MSTFASSALSSAIAGSPASNAQVQKAFATFLLSFREMPTSDFYYRQLIRANYRRGRYFLHVDLAQLGSQASHLRDLLVDNPSRYLPIFEEAAREIVEQIHPSIPRRDAIALSHGEGVDDFADGDRDDSGIHVDVPDADADVIQDGEEGPGSTARPIRLPPCQLLFTWRTQRPQSLRTLAARHVSKLVCITGIVTKASRAQTRAISGYTVCPLCRNEISFAIQPGHALQLPQCGNVNPLDGSHCRGRHVIVPDRCNYLDTQSVRIQELQEAVPTGEIPRSLSGRLERYLVEACAPGSRVRFVGILCTSRQASQGVVRSPYLRVIGIEALPHQGIAGASAGDLKKDGMSSAILGGSGGATLRDAISIYSDPEEERFLAFARTTRHLYDKVSSSIDPGIFGHVDIKKAIICQLFGGTRRHFRDGTRRRGDIHVLLLGDPSTAKSQLLKYTEKVAPISVYTSGKGSSAAGLTASVVREPQSREFYLEGGSMVLADGGICCIDEFDKMNESDRVAIHEAMEQQTISIAKAGITTVLNSRTSVLAAANPVGGRYEDYRSMDEQIDFQTTILSRFDLIFIVRDVLDRQQDTLLANHVANLHVANHGRDGGARRNASGRTGPVDIQFLTSYIAYCRRMCHPALTEDAVEFLTNYYVSERQRAAKQQSAKVIPITVRQLEALMRLTESLAKMHLRTEAGRPMAEEAVRLFKASTVQAIQSGQMGKELLSRGGAGEALESVQKEVRARVAAKTSANVEWLVGLLEKSKQVSRSDVHKALYIMWKRGEIDYRNKRRSIYRKK